MQAYFHASPRTLRRYKQVQSLLDRLQPEARAQVLLVPGSARPHGTLVVFPGSFNPPSTAHLALLKQARQFVALHAGAQGGPREAGGHVQLYAAVSKHIVDKESVERPLLLDRIMLLSLLLRRRLPRAGVLLFNRGLYVEQAEAVRMAFPAVRRLYFLLGYDKIVQILDPHYYADRAAALDELFNLARLLVAPRGDGGIEELRKLLGEPQNRPYADFITPLPFAAAYRAISSMRIRQDPAGSWREVPSEVRDFMRRTRAYAPPLHLPDGTTIDFYAERVKELQARLRSLNGEK
jgi:nicotinic acid mononucleotide adenylyltransferase